MFGGKARVGKTTVTKWFSEFLYNKGYSPVIIPFADIIKQEVEKTGITKESNPEQYRIACQVLGSSMRKLNPDYWIIKFEEKLNEIKKLDIENLEISPKNWHEKCVLVDDCRYLNETNYGRKIDALQIFIAHGKRNLIEHNAEWRNHESEDMANKIESGNLNYSEIFHYRLFNETSLSDFKTKATGLFEDWLDYMKADDKKMCSCISCMKYRYDQTLTLSELEKILNKAHRKFLESDNDNCFDLE
jgi:hypothetical protein